MKIIKKLAPALLMVLAGCRPQTPLIHSIYPQTGSMGETVTIKGASFGKERDESYITIAGAQPTGMSYLEWQDNEIMFRTPEFGEAGLVYVYVKGKKSNGVLFTNRATLPRPVRDDVRAAGPRVTAVTPQSGTAGALVSIYGTGFGNSRGNGGVFFAWNALSPASAPLEARVQEFAEVAETEFGYELWTDREIRVRIPDGASGGNMEIRTARGGSSPPLGFDLAARTGTKTFRDKRSYTVNYSVNVKTGEAQPPNTLYLWIPHPAASAAQRNAELLSASTEPFIDSYRGISLYKLDNLTANSDEQINLSWKVEVYRIETTIWSQSVRQEQNSPLNTAYTQSSPQLPADDPRIVNQAAALAGRERNSYTKAQRVYEWMTGGNFVWESQSGGDIFSALETKHIDSCLAALLYCSLLRSAGVPCQPVAGVLVSRNQQTMNHYWAEFWLDGFGWVPVDPAMGAKAIPAPFSVYEEQPNFYFGNIDNQRIAFSRGFSNLSPMDPHGRTAVQSRSYSLQNIREEAIGGIESYSSLWGDITITGIYAQ
ncbi:MAG: IPT/TIG domain-containing protein [Treponema sp.]|jgi:transglutaminase-like putative cysteine protease|nr:IPT/TIG domain-containing protein [Treponema sp.]